MISKMVDLQERMAAMLHQEVCSYKTEDYLAPNFQQQLLAGPETSFFPSSSASHSSQSSSSASSINEVWREKICEWAYQVIDHFDFSREIVGVAIHYLDRYLATRSVNKKVFQLAAMTSLFLAIKLYESGRISMASMIELSRGYFTVEQMVAMETSILRALSWHVHPPNAYCFAKHMLFFLPHNFIRNDVRNDILELARFLTELSVIDYFFVAHRPSHVAMAALLNAMEHTPGATQGIEVFTRELERTRLANPSSDKVIECRKRLRLLYVKGGYSRPTSSSSGKRNETVSPVCVSYGCRPEDLVG